METMKRFIIWEAATRDTIDVKRCYIDITGDLVSGVLLSQILFWFLPNRSNELKVKILKDGRYWLCKERTDWWDECRVSEYQFDRAIKDLCQTGIIIKKIYKFDNTPKIHLSIDFDALNNALIKYYQSKKELLESNMGLANMLSSIVIEPTEKESYLSKIKGLKLDLYNSANRFFEKNPPSIDIKTDNDLKLFLFEMFWDLYDYKQRKPRAELQFKKLTFDEIKKILEVVPQYVKQAIDFKLAAHNYIKDRAFNDAIPNYKKEEKQPVKDLLNQNIDKSTEDYFSKFQQ